MFKYDSETDRAVKFFIAFVWLHIKIGEPDACWPWIGGRGSDGYGVFDYNGRAVRAPKVIYTLTKGDIPEGLEICHSCDFPACCNPAHLSAATQAENQRQKAERGRCANVGKGVKLSYEIAEEIRLRYARARGKGVGLLAAEYGITRQMLTRIINRKSWKAPPPERVTPPSENITYSMGRNASP